MYLSNWNIRGSKMLSDFLNKVCKTFFFFTGTMKIISKQYDWSSKEGRSDWETDFDEKYFSRLMQVKWLNEPDGWKFWIVGSFTFTISLLFNLIKAVFNQFSSLLIWCCTFKERQEFFEKCQEILSRDRSMGKMKIWFFICFVIFSI